MAPRRQHVGFRFRELLLWSGFVAFCLCSVASVPLASARHAGKSPDDVAWRLDVFRASCPAILSTQTIEAWQHELASGNAGIVPGCVYLAPGQISAALRVSGAGAGRVSQSLLLWGVRLQI